MHFVDVELPDDFSEYGSGNYFTMSLQLKMWDKTAPVKWAVQETAFNYDCAHLKVLIPEKKK